MIQPSNSTTCWPPHFHDVLTNPISQVPATSSCVCCRAHALWSCSKFHSPPSHIATVSSHHNSILTLHFQGLFSNELCLTAFSSKFRPINSTIVLAQTLSSQISSHLSSSKHVHRKISFPSSSAISYTAINKVLPDCFSFSPCSYSAFLSLLSPTSLLPSPSIDCTSTYHSPSEMPR